jgi:hypothetical protein
VTVVRAATVGLVVTVVVVVAAHTPGMPVLHEPKRRNGVHLLSPRTGEAKVARVARRLTLAPPPADPSRSVSSSTPRDPIHSLPSLPVRRTTYMHPGRNLDR